VQAKNRNSTDANLNYRIGTNYLRHGNHDLALEHLLIAVNLKHDYFEAHSNIAYIYRISGEIGKAIEYYKNALKYAPDNAIILNNYGLALQDYGNFDLATQQHLRATEINNQYPDAFYGLGCAYQASGYYKKAIEMFQHATLLKPDYRESYHALGNAYRNLGMHEEAVLSLTRALSLSPNFVEAIISLASSYMSIGNHEEALVLADRALRIQTENYDAISLKANILKRIGKDQEAVDMLTPYVGRSHVPASIAFTYANVCSDKQDQGMAIEIVKRVLNSDKTLTTAMKMKLYFAIGKIFDSNKKYSEAFKYYHQGNALNREKFDRFKHISLISGIMGVYTSDNIKYMNKSSVGTAQPCFVVGMPRSGTTLIEQIIDSHPDAIGAGELQLIPRLISSINEECDIASTWPYCATELTVVQLESLATDYITQAYESIPFNKFLVDKLPANYLYLGLIEQLFPEAKIIHCTRNPLDTCLSCYFQNFSRSHPYTYNLNDLAFYYNSYRQLMKHWENVSSLSIHTIEYENLVESPEDAVRRLLEFCGLEWDSRCLDFHNNKRYVGTASYEQVSKPLYQKSVGRWRHYKAHIRPLIDALNY
jgi:tetratricopeptide (TPR) repeat protein